MPTDTDATVRRKVQNLFTNKYENRMSLSYHPIGEMRQKTDSPRKGRPRSFDVDEALDQALEVFRRKSYEGTSISDLTEAMGVERPSLYAAFGDKEQLFRKVLDRYVAQTMDFMQSAAQEKTARGFVQRIMLGAVENLTDPLNPPGCLTVQGALACGEESEPVRKELISRREQVEGAIRDRLRRAKKEGDLPVDCDPSDLARYVATLINGIAVQAAGGTSRKELKRVVDAAMRGWPQCVQ